MSVKAGEILGGRYRLEERIGSGGMSSVYRAFDSTLERDVAIKLMHLEIAEDSDQLMRFKREARSVAALSHPHIVTVIDFGEDHERPYIVLELIEGQTLKQKIQAEGRLGIAEALAYAIEVGRALVCAHDEGIVHRDVKPQNILISDEGGAKITDFGIARTLDDVGLTATGRVLGTTDYVSPEQALGQDTSGQTDVYSLGIVLYEMLIGEPPYKGDNQVAVAMKHVRERVPDVQRDRPEVSATLAAVVERSTAPLEDRYTTMDDFVADLEESLAIEAARAGGATGEANALLETLPDRAKRRIPISVRHPWVVAVVIALLVGGGTVLALTLAGNAQRGTGSGSSPTPAGLKAVSLGQTAAKDYDPFAGDGENPSISAAVVDRDPRTSWNTEDYGPGGLTKPGVGIYVDAKPGIAARALRVKTPTPGFAATIYGSKQGPPKRLRDPGWVRLATDGDVSSDQLFRLDTAGQRFRYYLVWITKLPPDTGQVKVSEISLYS